MSLTYLWRCAVGVSSVCAVYCLEVLKTFIHLFFQHVIFQTVTPLLKTAKCKGYCTSCYNHQVSSESTWVGESLGCMCLMTTGSEVEWRQRFQEWGWDEEECWCDYSLYELAIAIWTLLQRVKDRARSNMRELVGHALWQKPTGERMEAT